MSALFFSCEGYEGYGFEPELDLLSLFQGDQELCAPFLSSPLFGCALPPAFAEDDLDMLALFLDENVVAPAAVRVAAPAAAQPVVDVIVIDYSDSDDDVDVNNGARLSKRMALDRIVDSFRVCINGKMETFVSMLAATQAYMLHVHLGRPDLAALFTRDGMYGRVSGPALRRYLRSTLRNAGLDEFPLVDPNFSEIIAEFVITARAVDDMAFRMDCCQAARLGLKLNTPCGALMVKLGRTLLRL